MAFSKSLIASLLLSLVLVQVAVADLEKTHKSDADKSPLPETAKPRIDCREACAERCRLSSRQRLCHRACGTCCARCNCVPPGTAFNYDVCPCYAQMTTHGGRRKCP